MILFEDKPNNYITQLIKRVLSINTINHLDPTKINYIDFNFQRKMIDKTRVGINGETVSNQQFKSQALDYFDKNYSKYAKYRNVVSNALDDYLIVESYFNY
jgi:hypothetical protein